MKKYLILMPLLLCLAFVAISCNNDDEPARKESGEFTGNWFEDLGYGKGYLIVLKSDGKYKAYDNVNILDGTYEDVRSGKWKYDTETARIILYYEKSDVISEAYYVYYESRGQIDVKYYDYDKDYLHSAVRTFSWICDTQVPTINAYEYTHDDDSDLDLLYGKWLLTKYNNTAWDTGEYMQFLPSGTMYWNNQLSGKNTTYKYTVKDKTTLYCEYIEDGKFNGTTETFNIETLNQTDLILTDVARGSIRYFKRMDD